MVSERSLWYIIINTASQRRLRYWSIISNASLRLQQVSSPVYVSLRHPFAFRQRGYLIHIRCSENENMAPYYVMYKAIDNKTIPGIVTWTNAPHRSSSLRNVIVRTMRVIWMQKWCRVTNSGVKKVSRIMRLATIRSPIGIFEDVRESSEA